MVRDESGEIYTVRYEGLNAMMLNEFLKEHRKVTAEQHKVEEQGRTIQELKGLVANQQSKSTNLAPGCKE